MSDWQKYVIETIDRFSGAGEFDEGSYIDGPISVFIELRLMLEKAIKTNNVALVEKIAWEFRYYLLHTDDDDNELFTGVVIGLMEHLLETKGIEPYLKLFLSKEEFISFKMALCYHAKQSRYEEILNTIYK